MATLVTASALLAAAACNTPRDAAQADSAAGGSPTAKLDSTSNPATIDGDTTGRDTSRTTPPTP